MERTTSPFHLMLLAVVCAVLAWSGMAPYDRVTWWLEVAPVLIAVPLLAATYRSYRLTDLLYALVAVHCVILMVGGAYTYARVPFGFDLQQWLGLSRNPYDRIGHFAQGFIPAMVAREILLRGRHVARGKMLGFIVICIVLAISATYELIEWGAAVALGQGADEFLGTQGDQWDTQSDMFMALLGGAAALLTLSRWHDRQLKAL
ncbi:DUF2238 domain-containing protein [Pseudoduganella sp. DS3]|uniref:DUF2238 domain-containing protein n=1 Tax=Pseudoduganella guangdongensis TaxID=2692179 RepID=A0A6N9HB55_9BURK|nr:DUF2238 domain-containing protein [Pseudoduganella guangdongensis]MYN00690.1 DUF2238 domain-containing protein [Pseudoduganella guangdongensis]